jgi:hypothetical protein
LAISPRSMIGQTSQARRSRTAATKAMPRAISL